MNKDLFLAILAMDSYNREYGAGVNLTGSATGNASIITRASLGISETEYADWQAAGFYAIAYNVSGVAGFGATEKVISYRGTNFDPSYPTGESVFSSPIVKDAFNGWSVGAGFEDASQAELAIRFYEDVANQSVFNPISSGSPILLTGHSLGGGLAQPHIVGGLCSYQVIGLHGMSPHCCW